MLGFDDDEGSVLLPATSTPSGVNSSGAHLACSSVGWKVPGKLFPAGFLGWHLLWEVLQESGMLLSLFHQLAPKRGEGLV